MLASAQKIEDPGRHFGADLCEAEIEYLVQYEWARHAQDELWRRSRKGLNLSAGEAAELDEYMAAAPVHMAG